MRKVRKRVFNYIHTHTFTWSINTACKNAFKTGKSHKETSKFSCRAQDCKLSTHWFNLPEITRTHTSFGSELCSPGWSTAVYRPGKNRVASAPPVTRHLQSGANPCLTDHPSKSSRQDWSVHDTGSKLGYKIYMTSCVTPPHCNPSPALWSLSFPFGELGDGVLPLTRFQRTATHPSDQD